MRVAVSRYSLSILLFTSMFLTVGLGLAQAQSLTNTTHAKLEFSTYLLSSRDRINALKVGGDGSVYVAGMAPSHAAGIDLNPDSAGAARAIFAKVSPDSAKSVSI